MESSSLRKQKDRGFIAIIIIVIIALALLKYLFDWSIFEATTSPQGQETVSYTRKILDALWSFTGGPITWIWNNIVWPVLEFAWHAFQSLLLAGKESSR